MARRKNQDKTASGKNGAGTDGLPARDELSPGSPHPLYQQIKNYIMERIKSGQWPPETRVPSENELVETLGISRMTVNRALRELTGEGHLFRLPGVGTFVAMNKPKGTLVEIKSIAEEIAEWGGRHTSDVHLLIREKAPADLAAGMGLKTGSPVFHSVLVHRDRGKPVMLSDRYVNPAVAPFYLDQDFTVLTPSDYLLSVAPLQDAEYEIEAVMPESSARRLLEMDDNEPCLIMHRRTWSFSQVATKSRLIYPGSRYRLGGTIKADKQPRP